MKLRIYDKNCKVVGTFRVNGDGQIIGLQFPINSKYCSKFKKEIQNFLGENNLRVVSNEGTKTRHNNFKGYKKKREWIDIYVKGINIRTQKIELKLIRGEK